MDSLLREFLDSPLLAAEALLDPDLSEQVRAYVLRFPAGTLYVKATDDAELDLTAGRPAISPEFRVERSEVFECFIGHVLADYWRARNARGYSDFLQLMFYDPESESRDRRCVQLIGMPLVIDSYVFDH